MMTVTNNLVFVMYIYHKPIHRSFNATVLTAVAQIMSPDNLFIIEGDSPNVQTLDDGELCVEIVPSGFPGFAQVTVSASDDSATRKF